MIALASASPRRKDIFDLLRIDCIVIKPLGCSEKILEDPVATVVYNSRQKAENVSGQLKEKGGFFPGEIYENKSKRVGGRQYRPLLIAGFDTIVYFKKDFYGKPGSKEDASEMLKSFSGNVHSVISGVCVIEQESGKCFCDSEKTLVKFREIDDGEIKRYVAAENVLDKAGGYNIYGYGGLLVERIDGCFFNVAGLPISRFLDLCKKFDYKVL